MSAQAAILAAAVAYAPKIPALFVTMALMDTWGRRRLLSTFVPAMGLCLAGLAAALGARGPGAAAASLAAISLYGVFFGLSLGPIPNIYTAESFPTRAPARDAAAAPGGPDRTSGPSSSVASKSIRPDGGRVDGPRRPLDGRRNGRVDVVRTRARRGRVAYVGFPRRHARSAAMTASLAAQFASHAAVSFYFPVVVARRGPRAAFAAFAAVCGVTWVFVRAAVPETAQASLEDLATRAA